MGGRNSNDTQRGQAAAEGATAPLTLWAKCFRDADTWKRKQVPAYHLPRATETQHRNGHSDVRDKPNTGAAGTGVKVTHGDTRREARAGILVYTETPGPVHPDISQTSPLHGPKALGGADAWTP